MKKKERKKENQIEYNYRLYLRVFYLIILDSLIMIS